MPLYTDVNARPPAIPEALKSSLRHRRLVIAGYVAFDPVALARPSMAPPEIALLTLLMRRARSLVEFGAGGSTTLALKLGIPRVISVESDAAWIERIHADEAAARATDDGRLTLLHADIGPVERFGGPRKDSDKQKWSNYHRAPWAHIDPGAVDLVLVDGRFRVACILESILRVERRTLVAIHDFWNRPAYHCVIPFLDEIDRCKTLGVFRVKQSLDRGAVSSLLSNAADWPH